MLMDFNTARALKFSENFDNYSIGFFGGGCPLGNHMQWPTDPMGHKLVHAFSLVSDAIEGVNGLTIPKGYLLSVFLTYKPGEYFLDSICYHGDSSELQDLNSGYMSVILHKPDIKEVNLSPSLLPRVCINIDVSHPIESNQGSRIGGEPGYLQIEEINIDNMKFVLQIRGDSLPEKAKDLFFSEANIGYLFISEKLKRETKFAGLFFSQTT